MTFGGDVVDVPVLLQDWPIVAQTMQEHRDDLEHCCSSPIVEMHSRSRFLKDAAIWTCCSFALGHGFQVKRDYSKTLGIGHDVLVVRLSGFLMSSKHWTTR